MRSLIGIDDLSTQEIDELIAKANDIIDDGRPDIAIVFSNDPTKAEDNSVDVVIIELKKRGIKIGRAHD